MVLYAHHLSSSSAGLARRGSCLATSKLFMPTQFVRPRLSAARLVCSVLTHPLFIQATVPQPITNTMLASHQVPPVHITVPTITAACPIKWPRLMSSHQPSVALQSHTSLYASAFICGARAGMPSSPSFPLLHSAFGSTAPCSGLGSCFVPSCVWPGCRAGAAARMQIAACSVCNCFRSR